MISANRPTFAFVPGTRVVVHDPDSVEVRTGVWSSSSVTLADDERRGVLGAIVRSIQDGQSVDAIARRLSLSEDAVGSVIDALIANHALTVREDAEETPRLPYLVAPTLGSMHGRSAAVQDAILLGPSAFTDHLASILPSALRDRTRVAAYDSVRRLMTRDLFLEADGLTAADAAGEFEDWRGRLVVAAWAELHPILFANLNQLAHRVGFSFLPAVVDGPFVIVGPTVVPGATPCFACAETRVLESLRDHTLYTGYRAALGMEAVYGEAQTTVDPLQATTLSLAAWEVTNMLTMGASFTLGKLLTLYAPTFEVTFHELLRVPGCHVCSPRGALDQPLYSDLRSYLRTQLDSPEVSSWASTR
jgi:bacteriocin biosynthesis cyclodehydratase domain-containing protein